MLFFIFFFFFHLHKKLTQRLKARIKIGMIAIAFTLVKVLTALGTKSLAVLTAQMAHGELHFKLFVELLVHIEESVLNDSVLVKLVFVKITKQISGSDGFLKVKRELAGNGRETARTLCAVLD
jgi:hypothetical protein